ncbi:MAG: hypothetical protein HS126_40510 [Anaerolineales bacterium]|nr:hypothetical protein [Anaerolineales bacterium]
MTGQEVPDETARVPAYKYLNPRPAEWPPADFIALNAGRAAEEARGLVRWLRPEYQAGAAAAPAATRQP